MLLRCPHCASPEVTSLAERAEMLACESCDAAFHRGEALVSLAVAEARAEDRAACTCSDVRGCPQCFQRADEMVGALVRDGEGREWEVTDTDEKNGFPTVCGKERWAYLDDVTVTRDSAPLTVPDAETHPHDATPDPLFTFDPKLAAIELRKGDGAIMTVNPYSDADELNDLLDGAQAARIIESARARARLYVYPLSVGEPEPLLAVDPGQGPTLLGHSLKLRQNEGEDPISFTVRFLEEAVAEANGLAADRAADSARRLLDG